MSDQKSKYVCIKGCGLKGERINVGDEVKANADNASKIRQLLAMGRIVDVNTAEGEKAAKAALPAKPAKAALPGK